MNVLAADDDLTSRTMPAAILKKSGYNPVPGVDGAAAWEALCGSVPPMLVLLDWNMPGMDGLEVCRLLRNYRLGSVLGGGCSSCRRAWSKPGTPWSIRPCMIL